MYIAIGAKLILVQKGRPSRKVKKTVTEVEADM